MIKYAVRLNQNSFLKLVFETDSIIDRYLQGLDWENK